MLLVKNLMVVSCNVFCLQFWGSELARDSEFLRRL